MIALQLLECVLRCALRLSGSSARHSCQREHTALGSDALCCTLLHPATSILASISHSGPSSPCHSQCAACAKFTLTLSQPPSLFAQKGLSRAASPSVLAQFRVRTELPSHLSSSRLASCKENGWSYKVMGPLALSGRRHSLTANVCVAITPSVSYTLQMLFPNRHHANTQSASSRRGLSIHTGLIITRCLVVECPHFIVPYRSEHEIATLS